MTDLNLARLLGPGACREAMGARGEGPWWYLGEGVGLYRESGMGKTET